MTHTPTRSTNRLRRSISFPELDSRRKRGAFFRFMSETYGMDMQKLYRMLNKPSIEQWEYRGMLGCIHDFTGDDSINDIYQWYESLPDCKQGYTVNQQRRMAFYEYMLPMGLSRDTITKHFQAHDWQPIQIYGMEVAWNRFKDTVGVNHE